VNRVALLDLGFRPFYLLASIFAALSVALWAAQYSGWLPGAYLAGSVWHAHEMLFGYTMAVIAGFLFTAVRNWTQRPTPRGPLLAAFALLWIAGRILVLTPYALAAAVVNAAFPLAIAAGIAVPMLHAGNRRNYFFIALLAAIGVAALCVHLAFMGVIDWPARAGLQAGLDVVLFIVAVIAGRVIPMFTNNGVPGAGARRLPWIERLSLASLLALLAADLAGFRVAAGIVAAVAVIAHAWRLALWNPWKTLRAPLVWILHASYAWIVVHLALRALAVAGFVPGMLAIHALTIGVIGGMTIGMMTRTARGHSGRPLVAGAAEVAAYSLVMAAALVRVAGGWIAPHEYIVTVNASAVCWSSAFAIYAIRYFPILVLAPPASGPGHG
jgi:uncharacterized protein involved in response to NO